MKNGYGYAGLGEFDWESGGEWFLQRVTSGELEAVPKLAEFLRDSGLSTPEIVTSLCELLATGEEVTFREARSCKTPVHGPQSIFKKSQ